MTRRQSQTLKTKDISEKISIIKRNQMESLELVGL